MKWDPYHLSVQGSKDTRKFGRLCEFFVFVFVYVTFIWCKPKGKKIKEGQRKE